MIFFAFGVRKYASVSLSSFTTICSSRYCLLAFSRLSQPCLSFHLILALGLKILISFDLLYCHSDYSVDCHLWYSDKNVFMKQMCLLGQRFAKSTEFVKERKDV